VHEAAHGRDRLGKAQGTIFGEGGHATVALDAWPVNGAANEAIDDGLPVWARSRDLSKLISAANPQKVTTTILQLIREDLLR
jgi:hypothetical protein